MLRTLLTVGLSLVLAALSVSSFRQFPNEFGDAEPGSMLFGVLHLTIALSAAVAAVGVLRRSGWASWAIAICGAAATGLLAAQPLFTPMAADAQEAIWLGTGLVFAATAGAWWIARRIARTNAPPAERTAQMERLREHESPLLEAARSVDLGDPSARLSRERVHRDARGERVESNPQRDGDRREH